MTSTQTTHLSLTVQPDSLRRFFVLTGVGFKIKISAPCTLADLLGKDLNVEPAYVADRIQTIFLNAKAVDDPAATLVLAGDSIGLSGPMPGVAGAVLRKQSRLSSMRSSMSHTQRNRATADQEAGDVTIRLFNVLQEELGRQLLQIGMRIPGESWSDFLCRNRNTLSAAIQSAELDEIQLPPKSLWNRSWSDCAVVLRVHAVV